MDTQRWKAVKLAASGGRRLVGEGRDVLRSNGRLAVRAALGRVRANLTPRASGAATWPRQPLGHSYDVIVIGEDLATFVAAEVITRRSPRTRVAVLTSGFAGHAVPCRPRAVLRTARERPAEVDVVARSAALYEQYVVERGVGTRLRAQPALTLACDLAELRQLERRAAAAPGACRLVGTAEAAELVAHLGTDHVAGALLEPDVLSADVDELLWELGGRASAAGAEVVEHCRIEGVEPGPEGWTVVTSRGRAQAEVVIDATADGRALSTVGHRPAGTWRRWESIVTQHVQPFLRAHVLVGGAELSQTARGEVVVGGHATPYPGRQAGGSVEAASWLAGQAVRAVPRLGTLRVIAQSWRADLVPEDGLPAVGATGVDGLFRLGGLGADPLALGPALAEAVAHLAIGREPPVPLGAFDPARAAAAPAPPELGAADPARPLLSPLVR